MFSPRLAAASLSGESDADWARTAEPHVGAAFLGGIAIDKPTQTAAADLVERGRSEFLTDDPLAFVADQLDTLDATDLFVAVNVRATATAPIRGVAAICADYGAGVEVNAHCRQEELCAIGCGESLLRDTDRVVEYVSVATEFDVPVGVKVRAEVDGVDLPELAARLANAGASWIHLDAMDSASVVSNVVAAAPDLFVVANNGVRDRETAHEYLRYGADAVSVGRPSDDPAVLGRVRTAVDEWFETEGTPRTSDEPEVSVR